jgi:hypothetical protein
VGKKEGDNTLHSLLDLRTPDIRRD